MFFFPGNGVESWRALLADPERQWRRGYSARALAYSWEEAGGFPKEVKYVFEAKSPSVFSGIECLAAFPEHKVKLPGAGLPSQNDIFVLARCGDQLISIMVEGKVSETFGSQIVSEWLRDGGTNRANRLDGLASMLGLEATNLGPIWYQLVHRTASALIEAERFGAGHALMLVHSFSQTQEHFEDYAAFAKLLGVEVEPESIVKVGQRRGKELYLGWVTGATEYLER